MRQFFRGCSSTFFNRNHNINLNYLPAFCSYKRVLGPSAVSIVRHAAMADSVHIFLPAQVITGPLPLDDPATAAACRSSLPTPGIIAPIMTRNNMFSDVERESVGPSGRANAQIVSLNAGFIIADP